MFTVVRSCELWVNQANLVHWTWTFHWADPQWTNLLSLHSLLQLGESTAGFYFYFYLCLSQSQLPSVL